MQISGKADATKAIEIKSVIYNVCVYIYSKNT